MVELKFQKVNWLLGDVLERMNLTLYSFASPVVDGLFVWSYDNHISHAVTLDLFCIPFS